MNEEIRGLRLQRILHYVGRRYDPVYPLIRTLFPLQCCHAVIRNSTPHRISHRRPFDISTSSMQARSETTGSGAGSASATPPQGGSDREGSACWTYGRMIEYRRYRISTYRPYKRRLRVSQNATAVVHISSGTSAPPLQPNGQPQELPLHRQRGTRQIRTAPANW